MKSAEARAADTMSSTLQKQMVKRLRQRLLIQKNLSLGAGSLPQEIM